MKTTILLSLLALLTASALHAQIEKGRIQGGGSLSLSYQNPNSVIESTRQRTIIFSISPSAGMFYKTNRMYGAFLNFIYDEFPSSPHITRTYGGGVFFRQYQPVAKKLYILFDERGTYSYQSETYDNNNSYHTQSITVSAQAGMAYDITRKMQLELLLNNLISAGYFHSGAADTYLLQSSLESPRLSDIAFGFRFYLK